MPSDSSSDVLIKNIKEFFLPFLFSLENYYEAIDPDAFAEFTKMREELGKSWDNNDQLYQSVGMSDLQLQEELKIESWIIFVKVIKCSTLDSNLLVDQAKEATNHLENLTAFLNKSQVSERNLRPICHKLMDSVKKFWQADISLLNNE